MMTTEELLALPDDGYERWLIRGELRQSTTAFHDRFHATLLPNIAFHLKGWCLRQPAPSGQVVGGEAGFRLARSPDTTLGIDVAYVGPNDTSNLHSNENLFDGPPILAVEIASESDTQESIHEKIDAYLSAGVKLVWVLDGKYPLVTIYEAGRNPVPLGADDELTAEPHLPGFQVRVAALFE